MSPRIPTLKSRAVFAFALSLTLSLAARPAVAHAQPAPDPARIITTELVDAHIRYLSSDDMKGRDAFTPYIRRAEEYIAREFKAAGDRKSVV